MRRNVLTGGARARCQQDSPVTRRVRNSGTRLDCPLCILELEFSRNAPSTNAPPVHQALSVHLNVSPPMHATVESHVTKILSRTRSLVKCALSGIQHFSKRKTHAQSTKNYVFRMSTTQWCTLDPRDVQQVNPSHIHAVVRSLPRP